MPGLVATRKVTRSWPSGAEALRMRLEGDLELRAGHRELVELLGDPLLELPRGLGAHLAQLRRRGPCAGSSAFASSASSSVRRLARPLDRLDLAPAVLGVGEHRLDRAAVLALQPVERVEPLLHLLEPAGLGLDALGVAAQLGGQLLQLDRAGRARDSASRSSAGSTPSCAASAASAEPSRLRRPALVAAHDRQRLGGRAAQRLRVAKPLALGRELGLLGRVGLRRLDLLQLVAEDVEVALARSLTLAGSARAPARSGPPRRAPRDRPPGAPGARPRRTRRGSRAGRPPG